MLRTALDAAMTRPAPDDDRSMAERRHDAFLDLIRLGLDSAKLPERGGEPVHLGALVPLDDLRDVRDRRGRTVPQPQPQPSASDATRWVEPWIPHSPAAPLHPNERGERGIADAVRHAINN